MARRVLLRCGSRVAPGSRAVDVLCELVRAGGELVAKDTLIAHVWPDTVVTENNLQVQVSALRRAFAAGGGEREWLQTVPGRGYRFVAPLRPLADASEPAPAGPNI